MSANLSNKFLDRMFRRIPNIVWDLSSGKLGLRTPDGIYTLDQEQITEDAPVAPATSGAATSGDTAAPTATATSITKTIFGINVNPFEAFSMAIPAFATQVALENVKVGDLIIGERDPLGWVIEGRDRSLKLLDKSGMTKNHTPPKVAIIGSTGPLVVQNLFSLVGGNQGMGALQGSLMPLLMMGGGDDSLLESVIPMMLFAQQNNAEGGANAMQNMLPMILALKGGLGGSGGAGGIDPMMLMMMGGMGGGNGNAGGMNPMMMAMLLGKGGLGGGAPSGPAPLQVTRTGRNY